MGIELPPDLAGVAAATGASWPEADEDQMRSAAAAWRDAAGRMEALSGESDAAFSGALGTFSGPAADAAQAHWSEFVGADSGHLTVTSRGCLAAADRLEHAADQVGAAKVEIVRNLVDLARNTEAAEAAGTPTALLGIDTAVTATAANLGAVKETLVGAVAPNGPDVTAVRQVANANPGVVGPGGPLRDLVGGVAGVGPTGAGDGPVDAGGATDAVAGAAGGVRALGDAVAGPDGLRSAVGDAAAGDRGLVAEMGGLTDGAGRAVGVDGVTRDVVGGVSGAVEEAAGGVDSVTRDVVGGVSGVVGQATGGVDGVSGDVVGGVSRAVGQADGAVDGVTEGVVGAVSDAAGNVENAVDVAGSVGGGPVGGAPGALVGGISERLDPVSDGAVSAVDGVGDVAGESAGEVSKAVGAASGSVDTAAGGIGPETAGGAGRVIGPGDEWAMDLPTPPRGMPVADSVHASAAAVLDAPPVAAPQSPSGAPHSPLPQSPLPQSPLGTPQGGPALPSQGTVGAAPGAGGPAAGLPGPRAHSSSAPGRADSAAADFRSGEQRGGDQRARASDGSAIPGSSDMDSGSTPADEVDDDTPESGFGLAVPLGGAVLGGLGGGQSAGQAGPDRVEAGQSAPKSTGQPPPRGGPVLGMPVSPWNAQQVSAQPGTGPQPGALIGAQPGGQLARLPGVFAGASIGEAHRDQLSLFLLHLFPIGHLPQVVDEPHTQLPAPQAEVDYAAGLRFPPDDHPDARLVDATTPAPVTRTEGGPADHLATGYDPLGGLHERDWDRRFLVRPADEHAKAEYAWPPGEQYPEGGAADGEPEILEPGSTVDRLGTPEGRVFATDATPFAARSLPPDHLDAGLRRYQVVRPLPVWRTASAPWFGQHGGGIRLRATRSAVELVALGYLVEITEDGQ